MLSYRSPLTSLAAVLTVSLPLAAQTGVQIAGETVTALGVLAHDTTTTAATKILAKGTKFTTGLQAKAVSGSSSLTFDASIASGVMKLRVTGVAQGSKGATIGAYTDPTKRTGVPVLRFNLTSTTNVSGRLVVVTRFAAQGSSWSNIQDMRADLRVGQSDVMSADAAFDTVVTKEFGANLSTTPTPFDIRATFSGISATALSLDMQVEAIFVPGHRVTAYGENCAHLHTGFPAKGRVALHVTSWLPQSRTYYAIGLKRALAMHMGCKILVDPIAVVAGPSTDSLGRAKLELTLPNEAFSVVGQALVFEPSFRLTQLTNGLDMEFRKQ